MNTSTEAWTEAARALWARIEAHPLDDPKASFPFSAKLRKHTGWSAARAAKAISEYRRFCFLATMCGHEVAPSPTVDEVWHLHLLYTRDYWDVFCARVLDSQLHHEPANGCGDRDQALRLSYTDTLHSYQRYFAPPDPEIWPARRDWFRKQRAPSFWTRLTGRVAAVATALLILLLPSAQALPLDPLEWSGPDFLMLYVGLLIGVTLVARIHRHRLRRLDGAAKSEARLSPWEAAYLAGGGERVVDAAVAELHHRGVVAFDATTRKFAIQREDERLPPPLGEIARHLQVRGSVDSRTARQASWLNGIRRGLEQKRLLLDEAQRLAVARAGTVPMLVLVSFGIAKIVLGVSRDRPVALLVMMTAAAAVLALLFWLRRPQRSSAGDAWIHAANKRHRASTLAPRGDDLAMAVALAGTVVLADTALANYHHARVPASSDSSIAGDTTSTSDSSSSDSGGGDSGGSGCGGCGGGGGD